MEKLINLPMEYLMYFLDKDNTKTEQEVQKIAIRYLHDRGIEGAIIEDGKFIQCYEPKKNFNKIFMGFYHFVVNGGN